MNRTAARFKLHNLVGLEGASHLVSPWLAVLSPTTLAPVCIIVSNMWDSSKQGDHVAVSISEISTVVWRWGSMRLTERTTPRSTVTQGTAPIVWEQPYPLHFTGFTIIQRCEAKAWFLRGLLHSH